MDVSSSPLSVPPQPVWAQRFRSDDVDEVRQFVTGGWGHHSRVARGRGALGFDQSWVIGEATVAGWVRAELAETIRAASREPILHLTVPAGSEYRFGRRRKVARCGTVTFIAPGWEYTLDRPGGSAFAISVSGLRLREELAARLPGACSNLVLQARSIELGAPAKTRLVAAVASFVESTAPAADQGRRAHGEAGLIGELADLLLAESMVVRAQTISSARLADLEAWIDAHLDKPITVGRLCQVARVGERALQKAFESRRGMSPMRFIAERRLAAARRLLTVSGPNHDVTRVALSLGFGHTGRFALLYRQSFGETPSQSLRRATRQTRTTA
jgi:AraC-like DNA-binding protein